jgi:hypothetical protein
VVLTPLDPAAGLGNPLPIPGAQVFVPSGTVAPFDGGTACGTCTAPAAITATTSDIDGGFTLPNVPCGTSVPVVIQEGRWRRQLSLTTTNGPMALTADQTRFPRKQAEFNPNDNIPLIAVVTGAADTIECVLPKLGIDSTEFTAATGTGRVRFYQDSGAGITGGNTAASTLYGSASELSKYDIVIIGCVGQEIMRTAPERSNIENWAISGGRLFATHYAYVWLYGSPSANSFTPTATWLTGQGNPADQDALINTGFTRGNTFAEWVYQVGIQGSTSTTMAPRVPVANLRNDISTVNAPAVSWMSGTTAGTAMAPFLFSFETPVGGTPACGRVFFNDFHAYNTGGSTTATLFPAECAAGTTTELEKVFQYLFFDLAACVP